MRKIIAYIKERFRRKDGKQFNYPQHKNTYVEYSDRKPKIKLRRHIAKLANHFNELNHKGYNFNRELLINEFEYLGIEGVSALATKQIKIYMTNLKKKR